MRSLPIDFAPQTTTRLLLKTKRATWLFFAIGFILSGTAIVHAVSFIQTKRVAQVVLQHTQLALAANAARTPSQIKMQITDLQVNALSAAIAQLNLPWSNLLNAIEDTTPSAIALLSLEPDSKKMLLRGIAEAKSSGDMLAYIERLKEHPFFASVVLTKHDMNELDPNKPFRFQFECRWMQVPR